MTRGRFISFEGGEGCGKSTQSRLLAEALQSRGIATELTREPGGTDGAEAIRNLLLDPSGPGWTIRSEALLFAAARADHVATRIEPALSHGSWVVCDRFIDSSRAYQSAREPLRDEDILTLHRVGSEGFMPDLTILIEVEPEEAAQRLALRDGSESDRIGGRSAEYHAAVARRFSTIADAEPERVLRLSGSGTPEAVHLRVMSAVEQRLELPL